MVDRNKLDPKTLIVYEGMSSKNPYLYFGFKSILNKKIKIYSLNINPRNFSFIKKVFAKFRIPLGVKKLNNELIDYVKDKDYDLIVIMKGNYIIKSTIQKLKKKSVVVNWSADNMLKMHNASRYYFKAFKLYDNHITTKSFIVNRMLNQGAKKVTFVNKAFSKQHHFPVEFDPLLSFDILFIGTYEKDRFNYMNFLAESGLNVDIFGSGWGKIKSQKNLKIHNRELYENDYRKAVSSSKINLCFLRKINNDLQTSRTMEIPATKGFMIAERTIEHLNIFKEDIEAVFFDNKEELLAKTIFYLKNNEERDVIRENGYKKVIKMDYTYENMAKTIIQSSL